MRSFVVRTLAVAFRSVPFIFFVRSKYYQPLISHGLPLSETQLALAGNIGKWILAVVLVRDINAALNRWADNRWLWTDTSTTWHWLEEVAVVTGGSRGIGAAVVRALVTRGIKVAVLDVDPLTSAIPENERELVRFYRCDVTSPSSVHEAGEAVRSELGSPSILINNAGIGSANTILSQKPERVSAIFNVNIVSHWFTLQEFLPDMIARKKGHIMSTASMSAWVTLTGGVDYSCTKAGLVALHEGLTQELKHRYRCPQVKTSIIFPTFTRTPMLEPIAKAVASEGQPIMDPADVAEAMVKHIIENKSGQILLGPDLAAYVRVLPCWLQELLRDGLANAVKTDVSKTEE